MNKQQLIDNIRRKQSFLCVGLDTDIKKIPDSSAGQPRTHLRLQPRHHRCHRRPLRGLQAQPGLLRKPGREGDGRALEKTVRATSAKQYPDQLVIADAKRGDIGNTSAMYAHALFEDLRADCRSPWPPTWAKTA